MGTAAPYTVLGTNATAVVGTVTCTSSTIDGDVGSTFTSITNTGCTITGSTDAPVAASVVTDFNTAFAAIDTKNPVCTGVIPTVSSALTPGVYCSAAATTLGAITLTLNGNASDVWVFRVGTGGAAALTLTGTTVVMGGTARACNVFWKTSAAMTATDSTFNGTVLSGAAVTMTRGSWSGRALATTDATVTGPGTLTFAGCSAPVPPTVAKAFSPASITAGGVSRLTITLSNANVGASNLTAAFTDTLPTSPSAVLIAATPNAATTCGGTVTATAGAGSVTLSQAGSTIPASGSCTVAVNVTAAAPGSFTNTIAAGALQTSTGNNAASATATLTATCPVITLGPAAAPAGIDGTAYSQQLTASGGITAYTFTVSAGALPAGLSLSSSGLLSGTPTTPGSTAVTIRAADGHGCPGTITYTIVIAAATCPVVSVAPVGLPSGMQGVAYSRTITASGGTGAYTFVVLSGTLPAGLTLSSGGVLSGSPTTLGSSTATIQATDGSGCPGVTAYTIVIASATCPVITVTPSTLPTGTVGAAYSQLSTASGGTGAYTFTVLSGALPLGLTLSSGGVLSGTPTTAGSILVTIEATDGSACPGTTAYTIVIAAGVPTLPQAFVLLLALALLAIGHVRLRHPFAPVHK